jgi:SNF2 family DNA or RNA helicase
MITEVEKLGKFSFHTDPYEHQREDFERSRDLPYFAYFWEMGTGKSKPILDTALHLFLKQEIDGVLIVSDKGCYLNWHYDQIPKHVSSDWPIRNQYWASTMNRQRTLEVEELLVAKDDTLDFLCINVEALSHPRAYYFAEKFIRSHYCMMVVDESTSIKSHRAARTKACWRLGNQCDYRRIATGTPITQSPLDLWGQCEFLKQGLLGFSSFTVFKSHYAMIREVVQGRVRFEQILGYRNLDQLTKQIMPFSSRRLKDECLDLPEKVYETYYVEQTPEQKEAYRALREEALLLIDGGMVTITNALTLLGKLHQINCGHVKDDDGSIRRIPSNRVNALMELLDNIPGKVVIWGYYQEDVRIIEEAIRGVHGPNSYVTYFGETDVRDRQDYVARFRDREDCRWFIGTPATGGKGLNGLTVASHAIYYSNHYKLEPRLQSEDRIHRIGQVSRCTYTDMVCPRTVDVEIVQALKDKKDLATEVLDTIRLMLQL